MLWRACCGLLALIAVCSLAGCPGIVKGVSPMAHVAGSGNAAQEERAVSGFTGVDLATQGDLTIALGEEEKLLIEADDNLLPYFETEVRGDLLRIKTQQGISLRPRSPIRFHLTAKAVDTLILSGSGNIEAPRLEGPQFWGKISGSGNLRVAEIEAEAAEIQISGSGDARMGAVRGNRLETTISGSGDVRIAGGEVEQQVLSISGSGGYRSPDLASTQTDVRISGSGDATVRARDHLRASISGSGGVHYGGSPTVEKAISGSGRVEALGG